MANSLVTVIEQLGENYEIYNTDVVVIDTDSNCLGIGTQDPGARLHIDNNTNKIDVKINNLIINGISSEITCLHDSSYVSIPRLHILNDLSSNNITINNINNDSIQFKDDKVIFNKDISLNPNNNLLISRVNADVIASSQVNILSDDRLKHNEIDIKNALSTIRKLKPQKYQKTKQLLDYNYMGALNNEYTIEAGLIAQDIIEIDELKFTVNEGTSSTPYKLNYNNIFVYSLQAIKELDISLNNQQRDIDRIRETTNNYKYLDLLKDLSNKTEIINNQYNTMQILINKINVLTNRINILENKLN
jgi:hypothetical protein|tara:strand:+ start:8058 stop:8969 length:912 start_codon:yes stop_codon:yes gene_type:complete